MSQPITERADWLDAANAATRFFSNRDYNGERLEDRVVFYLQLAADCGLLAPGKRLLDLGAGICWFDPLAAKLGADVILADDFGGGGGVTQADRSDALEMLDRYRREFGIEIVEQDILRDPLPLPDSSIDGVTCFHSLEHWHHSPKALFAEIRRVLRPGGWLILATPNAANLRKRLHVILGANIWSGLEEWYHDAPVFRGHVREPIVRDLRQLCEWNGFRVTTTLGRNFIGRDSHALAWIPQRLRHGLVVATQSVLRFFPTLCSDIHVVAQKQ
ncbi:MAG: class I SAM-dependent methyltransferase [Chthoniobacteraceae bacterium]